MIFDDWFLTFVRTSAGVTLSAFVLTIVFRMKRLQSPEIGRGVIALVLLQGWMFWQFPITIETSILVESPIAFPDSIPPRVLTSQHTKFPERPVVDIALAAAAEPPKALQSDTRTTATVVYSPEKRKTPQISLWQMGLCTWIVGSLVVFVWTALSYLRFVRSLQDLKTPESEWAVEWRELRAELGLPESIKLLLSDTVGPCVFWRRGGYRIVAPFDLWAELSPDKRVCVLRHEAAHIQRHDLWKSLAVRFLAAPQWFNPLAWWSVRKFDEFAEFACDRAAAGGSLVHATLLSKVLLALGTQTESSATIPTARRGCIAERIHRLLIDSPPERRRRQVVAFVVVASLIVLQCSHLQFVSQSATAQTPGIEAQQGQPVTNGENTDGLIATLGGTAGRMWGSFVFPDITADGSTIYINDALCIAAYDAETLELKSRFPAHDRRCLWVALVSKENQLVSSSLDGTVRLWDLTQTPPALLDIYEAITQPDDAYDHFLKTTIAENREVMTVRAGKELIVLRIEDSKLIEHAVLPMARDARAALFKDGSRLVTSVGVRDADKNRIRRIIEIDGREFKVPAATLSLWNLETKQPTLLDESPVLAVEDLLIARGSSMILGSQKLRDVKTRDPDGRIDTLPRTLVWEVVNDKFVGGNPLPFALGNEVIGNAAFNEDGTLVAGEVDGHTEVIDFASKTKRTIHELPVRPLHLAFIPNSDSLIITRNAMIERWDLLNGKYHRRSGPQGHQSPAVEIFFDARRNQLVSSGGDKMFTWDITKLRDTRDDTFATPFSFGSAGNLTEWPQHDGLMIHGIHGITIVEREGDQFAKRHSLSFGKSYKSQAWCAAVHPNGKLLVTGHWDRALRFWDLTEETPTMTQEIERAHRGHVCDVVFSPDGKTLASVGWDHNVKLTGITSTNAHLYETLGAHEDIVRCAAFSPDGQYLATGGEDGQILLWDLNNFDRPPRSLRHPGDPDPTDAERRKVVQRTVGSLEYSNDGTRLLSADGAGRVTLWLQETGEAIKVWQMPGWVWCACFCDNERMIASGNKNGTISIWQTPGASSP